MYEQHQRMTMWAIFLLLAVGVLARVADAQTVEEHGVEQLTAEQLGPYEPVKQAELDRVAAQIRQRTNAFREQEGLGKLSEASKLQETAHWFARYMASEDVYGHQADGRQPSGRVKAHGYQYCMVAENIAFQFATQGFSTDTLADKLMEGWKT